jgi:hypothetical protein
VGDRPWALGLAGELSRNGVPTVLAARGRADLAARDDLPFTVHASLLIDLPRSGLLTDVRGAVVASRDDETDLIALGVLVEALGRSNVWLLPAEAGTASPGPVDRSVTVASWTRRPFAPGVSHDVLERSLAAGGRVTTVAGTDLPDGALVLARVRGDGSWTASAAGAFAPDDRLVVLDGAVVGPAGAGTGGRR